MNEKRIFRSNITQKSNEATYVMSSSFRLNDNHSLEYLVTNYDSRKVIIFYNKEDNPRNVSFITPYLDNLKESLNSHGIKTIIIHMFDDVINLFEGDIILDKEYLKEKTRLEEFVLEKEIPHIIFEDNISVPVEIVSDKEEYSARTIRPKIHKHLRNFIDPINLFPLTKGELDGLDVLKYFLSNTLFHYDMRNHPESNYTSGLSVYLKYGLISPVRILYSLDSVSSSNKDSFIEELIIRRELSYNFVHFNKGYNDFHRITYDWAYQTMNIHQFDYKEYLYTIDDYVNYKTHDIYFNTAMREMVILGRMHGYMRMYWCKKIIEWSRTFEEAYNTAIYLNNYYFLDGNTPNGYTGVAWCFGKHDRAWTERPIFGKLRYMNSNGLKRKFDINLYVERVEKEVKEYETSKT